MTNASIKILTDKCKACGLCIMYCPVHCIKTTEHTNALGYHPVEYVGTGCIGCCNCARICPDAAIEVFKESSADG